MALFRLGLAIFLNNDQLADFPQICRSTSWMPHITEAACNAVLSDRETVHFLSGIVGVNDQLRMLLAPLPSSAVISVPAGSSLIA